ncbi:MAG: alpha/beta hydrolase [Verrucomicrobia bacterium]|nr:alpha/beta hydrolase [Verrucomicrobiota bacterium]
MSDHVALICGMFVFVWAALLAGSAVAQDPVKVTGDADVQGLVPIGRRPHVPPGRGGGATNQPITQLLWPDGAPEAKGDQEDDKPSITVFLPPAASSNGTAVVICPGGAYSSLMMSYEGRDVAKWLNQYGIAAFVLKYRVSPYRHPVPMLDGQRAMRLVRSRAAAWGIDPKKIGMMGFSAGGHVASTVGTHFDNGNPKATDTVEQACSRPDFLLLIYPVITMGEKGHAGSRTSLLGGKPSKEDIELLSNEKQVTARTPPAFLAHAKTDQSVPVENSRMFAEAMKEKKGDVEFFELQEGAHGLGCGNGKLWTAWQSKCIEWLKQRDLIDDGAAPVK